jgi:hypothetical protein
MNNFIPSVLFRTCFPEGFLIFWGVVKNKDYREYDRITCT